MDITLIMYDVEGCREVNIRQSGIEYIGDFLEALLTYTKAAGYTYVDKITFSSDNGLEWSTL